MALQLVGTPFITIITSPLSTSHFITMKVELVRIFENLLKSWKSLEIPSAAGLPVLSFFFLSNLTFSNMQAQVSAIRKFGGLFRNPILGFLMKWPIKFGFIFSTVYFSNLETLSCNVKIGNLPLVKWSPL